MQISATVIAAQQAAREAQARFQANHVAPAKTQPGFAAALAKEEGFAPLPLKQMTPQAAPSQPDAPPLARPGSLLDIKI